MALDLEYRTGNDITVTNTEMSLTVNDGTTTPQTITDDGIYTVMLDAISSGTLPMVKGDEYLFRIYEKAHSSAGQRIIFQATLSDAQSENLIVPMIPMGIGWDVRLVRVSATSRKFYWTIRRIS